MQLVIVWNRTRREKAALQAVVLEPFEAAPSSRSELIKALGEVVESLPNNVATIPVHRPEESK